jgi:hypothetical protein
VIVDGEIKGGDIHCATPRCPSEIVRSSTEVLVSVSLNHDHFSATNHKGAIMNYYQHPRNLIGSPICGTVRGNTRVSIVGDHLSKSEYVMVRFRMADLEGRAKPVDVPGRQTKGVLSCQTPPCEIPQRCEVLIALNGQDFSTTKLEFLYVAEPIISSFDPPLVPFGQPCTLTINLKDVPGDDAVVQLLFPVGRERSERAIATRIPEKKALVFKLPIPSLATNPKKFLAFIASYHAKAIHVEVALDRQHFHNAGNLCNPRLGLTMYEVPHVTNIEPPGGPLTGGSNVTIRLAKPVRNQTDPNDVRVKLQHDAYASNLKISRLEQGYVKFSTLRFDTNNTTQGFVPAKVFISIHKDQFCPIGFTYLFYPEPNLDKMIPQIAHAPGGTVIIIKGNHIVDLQKRVCVQFGMIVVPATVLDARTIRCVTPPLTPGNHIVQVSLNGVDFHPVRRAIKNLVVDNLERLNIDASRWLGSQDGGSTIVMVFHSTICHKLSEGQQIEIRFKMQNTELITKAEFKRPRNHRSDEDGEIHCISPVSQSTGPAMLQISFNGQEYSTGTENVFYYHKVPTVADMKPKYVPLSGGSKVTLFLEHKDLAQGIPEELLAPCVRLTHTNRNTGKTRVIVPGIFHAECSAVVFVAPAWKITEKCVVQLELSLNDGVDFHKIANQKLRYYVQPASLVEMSPLTGPTGGQTILEIQLGKPFPQGHASPELCVLFHFVHSPEVNSSVKNIEDLTASCRVVDAKWTGTHVVCRTPECSLEVPAYAHVMVSFNRNDFINATDSKLVFEYYRQPTISKIMPVCCTNEGGTDVSIHGSGFKQLNQKHVVVKWVNRSASTGLFTKGTVVDDDLVTCKSPGLNYEGNAMIMVSLNSQQFTSFQIHHPSKREYINTIWVYKGSFYLLQIAGTCSGGDKVSLRGNEHVLGPTLDELTELELRFSPAALEDGEAHFAVTSPVSITKREDGIIEIAGKSAKVPRPCLTTVDLIASYPGRAVGRKKPVEFIGRYQFKHYPDPEFPHMKPFGGPCTGTTPVIITSRNISRDAPVFVKFYLTGKAGATAGAISEEEGLEDNEEKTDDGSPQIQAGEGTFVIGSETVKANYVETSSSGFETMSGCVICKTPEFDEAKCFPPGVLSLQLGIEVEVNGFLYPSNLKFTIFTPIKSDDVKFLPNSVRRGMSRKVAIVPKRKIFLPTEGAAVYTRLSYAGSIDAEAGFAVQFCQGNVESHKKGNRVVFMCPPLLYFGAWDVDISFNGTDFNSCGKLQAVDPALCVYVHPQKVDIQTPTELAIGCRAINGPMAKPQKNLPTASAYSRVYLAASIPPMLSEPLEAKRPSAIKMDPDYEKRNDFISGMNLELTEIVASKMPRNERLIVLVTCNGVSTTLSWKLPSNDGDANNGEQATGLSLAQVASAASRPRGHTQLGTVNSKNKGKGLRGAMSKILKDPKLMARATISKIRSQGFHEDDKKEGKIGLFGKYVRNAAQLDPKKYEDYMDALRVMQFRQGHNILRQVGEIAQADRLSFPEISVNRSLDTIQVFVMSVSVDPLHYFPVTTKTLAQGRIACTRLYPGETANLTCKLTKLTSVPPDSPVVESLNMLITPEFGGCATVPTVIFQTSIPALVKVKDVPKELTGLSVDLCVRQEGESSSFGPLSTTHNLPVFNPNLWDVLEVWPALARINSSAEISILVRGFDHVDTVTARFTVEGENGQVYYVEGQFDDEALIPAGSEAAGCRLVRCFTPPIDYPTKVKIHMFSDDQMRCSNYLTFEYLSEGKIEQIHPRHVPKSSGDTLWFKGSGFLETEQTFVRIAPYGTSWQKELTAIFKDVVDNQEASEQDSSETSKKEIMAAVRRSTNLARNLNAPKRQTGKAPTADLPQEELAVRVPKIRVVRGGNEDGTEDALEIPVIFINDKELKISVPKGLPADSIRFGLRTGLGDFRWVDFDVNLFSIRRITPSNGNTSGGTDVKIFGQSFPRVVDRSSSNEIDCYIQASIVNKSKAKVHTVFLRGVLMQANVSMNEDELNVDGETVVRFTSPAIPYHFVEEGETVKMVMELSLNGRRGPFTRDGKRFNCFQPMGVRSVRPNAQLIPGRSKRVHVVCDNLTEAAKVRIRCHDWANEERSKIPLSYDSEGGSELQVDIPFFTQHDFGHLKHVKMLMQMGTKGDERRIMGHLWYHQTGVPITRKRRAAPKKGALSEIDFGDNWADLIKQAAANDNVSLSDDTATSASIESTDAYMHRLQAYSKASLEVSINGVDWPEKGSYPVELVASPMITEIEPAFGSMDGGTMIELRCQNLVPGNCWIAFLMQCRHHIGVRDFTQQQTSSRRGAVTDRSAANSFGTAFNMNAARGAKIVQNAFRSYLARIGTRNSQGRGRPCVLMPAQAISTTVIRSLTPTAIYEGPVTLLVSYDKMNFQYISTYALNAQSKSQPSPFQTSFTYTPNTIILNVERSDGLSTDSLAIRGRHFEMGSMNITQARVRFRPALLDADDDSEEEKFEQEERVVSAKVVNRTLAECKSPPMQPGVPVLVALALNGQDFSNDIKVVMYNTPTLKCVEPEWCISEGGFPLTIHGDGFLEYCCNSYQIHSCISTLWR